MRNATEILCKAMVFSLLGSLLVSIPALAKPAPYSKTLTFTVSTNQASPPAARPGYYFPANTKYSAVKTQRAGTQVGVESLEIAHEGLSVSPLKPARVAR